MLQNHAKLNYLEEASDSCCSKIVRSCCAISVQKITEIMQSSWTPSLALDVGNKADEEYLDVRLRQYDVQSEQVKDLA